MHRKVENPAQEPSPVVVPQPQPQPQAPAGPRDGSVSTSFIPDSPPNSQVPSIQNWPGQYDFQISVPVGNKDRNKWCYSAIQEKLYLIKHVTIPLDVKLLEWLDAYITITPVFKASRNRVHHVMPCFNCSTKNSVASSDHIVMVEGQGCEYTYKYADKRPVVTLPLHPPPPGEAASTLLLKLVCLTSCNGGPNRRPFSLVFTLHNNSTGSEIGRQVLDLKCCQCPSRDMLNEDKAVQHPTQPSTNACNQLMEVRKRSGPAVTSTSEKKKRFTIKLEPGTDRRYQNVPVSIEAFLRNLNVTFFISISLV
ncbi:Cellular tumor antigen p53 [Chionoecetes opilio]|uniref:Cellular tumor antigen p53 n=1 Tax=Chionoecetes opilio TaxID=41210 RepID=A0A8J8W9N5_CHIOP|nr:Cellular tumor antigen p53 [Chionoecetes opilio]